MRSFLKFLLVSAVVICAAALAYSAFDKGMLRLNYPNFKSYPVQGLDVSHHQGVIDWEAVGQSEYQFVYIKATEGGDWVDTRFAENWDGAREAGLVVGAYHFFTFCRPGAEQAANVLATVPQADNALPIAVDLEFGGNCDQIPTRRALLAELNAFLDVINSRDARKPVFYVTPEFFDQYMAGHEDAFPDHYLWFRNIYSKPKQEPCADWQIWQFANRGRVAGIEGPVDLNAFCGDVHAFQAMFFD